MAPLPSFDVRSVPPGARLIYVGQSGSGKSSCLIKILRALRYRADMGYVWTNTLTRELGNVAAHFPPAAMSDISSGFDMKVAGHRLKYIQTVNDRLKAAGLPSVECHLVFEDCAYLRELHDNAGIHFLLMNGRRYCTTHITTQTPKAIGPHDRSNLSHVIILYDRSKRWLEDIYADYCTAVDPEAFWDAVSQLKPRQALVFQPFNYALPLSIMDVTPDDKPWVFGQPEWRQSMDQLIRPDYRDVELASLGRLFAPAPRRR